MKYVHRTALKAIAKNCHLPVQILYYKAYNGNVYLAGTNDSDKISESEQRNHNHQSLGSLHHSSVVVHGSLRAELAEDNLITNIMLHKTGSL